MSQQLMKVIYILLQILHIHQPNVSGIINLNPETANPIFHMLKPKPPVSKIWRAGVDCVDEIVKLYFLKRENLTRSYNIVITSAKNMSTPAAQIQEGYMKLMNEAVVELKNHELFQLRVVSDYKPFNRTDIQARALIVADYYLIVVDSITRLRRLMMNYVSRMNAWNPGARFLVCYYNLTERHAWNETTFKIYAELLNNFYIHRIAVLYAIDVDEYAFSSMDYFNKDACRTIMSRHLGFCRKGQLYPSFFTVKTKLEELQNHVGSTNCVFSVCAAVAEPFVEKDCEAGLELRIIALIKQRLGLNLEHNCHQETRGEMEKQGNWTGLLGKLEEKDCDFIIGGFYPDNEIANYFWASECYYDDTYTWFIKLADKRPAWLALFIIFDARAWLCFLLVVPITWLFWYFLTMMLPEPASFKEFSLIGLNNMGVSICLAVNERPLCHATRVFLLVLSLYGMNIVSTYTSRLIAVFANPGSMHQIHTLSEVIQAGIPFGGAAECHDWFENENDMWIYKRYNESELFEPRAENLIAVKNGERVILGSRMYVTQDVVSDKVFAFPGNVFSSPVQMIMKPGFAFMFEINWLIRHMRDMGIFTRLKNRFYFNNTYLSRIAKRRPEFQKPHLVITTQHLLGPFAMLIFGACIGLLFFIIELSVYGRVKQKPEGRRGTSKNKKTVLKLNSKLKQQPFKKSKRVNYDSKRDNRKDNKKINEKDKKKDNKKEEIIPRENFSAEFEFCL